MSSSGDSTVRRNAPGGTTTRRRLVVAAVGFLLLIVVVAWFAESSKQRAATNVGRLANVSGEVRAVSDLSSDVAELQRYVLIFRLTGNPGITQRIARLHSDLIERQSDLAETITDDERGELLRRMRGHLDAYYENSTILVANRRRLDELVGKELPAQKTEIDDLLDEALRAAGSDRRVIDILGRLRDSFARISSELLQFVIDPYAVRSRAMKENLRQTLDLVAELPAGMSSLKESLDAALRGFESDFSLLVQLTRGDLQLTNVVMAGSADEIARLSQELVALSDDILLEARYTAEAEIRRARLIDLGVLALAIVFALALLAQIVRAATRLAEVEEGLRESEQRFRATFDQAAVGIAHVGTDGSFLRVNQRLCDIVGYTAEELVALTFQDITHPDDLDADVGNVQRVLAGDIDTYSMDKRYICKDGSLVWVELTVSLVRRKNGDPRYFISVIEDITERKRAESKLRRSRAALARSNADLQQFAYVASHDLQEPLRMVSSYLQLLEKRYKGRLDEDADEFIHYAVDGAQRMKSLINDLLSLSRVDTRGKPFTAVEMSEVLGHALKNLEVSIDEAEATVTHDELPAVRGDAGQLEQLLQNLIGNAIKYRGEAAPAIHVSAEPVAETEVELPDPVAADGWLFAVRDNGIGIAPESAEEVFRIFRRLHANDARSGTGIGLSVCKKIVERHGGSIWVESSGEGGSVFYFTIAHKEPAA